MAPPAASPATQPVVQKKTFASYRSENGTKKSFTREFQKEKVCDVSDKTQWPKANLVLSIFPGTVVEVVTEDAHGS
jgi:hypothetical protein